MDPNPYAPPQEIVLDLEPSREIFVDGDCLVVYDQAVLPNRCVATNRPARPRELRTRRFEWAPSFRLVLRRRVCHLSFYLSSRHARARYLVRLAVVAVATLLGVFWWGGIVWPLAFALLMIVGLAPVDGLSVEYERRGQFWIHGFGPEFLASCRQEFGPH
ncbi:MAG: hypothetical protein AB7O38_01050 [Pirellulaceae bacterium]